MARWVISSLIVTHRRLAYERTRNRDALLLAARELSASLADECVVAVLEGADEVMRVPQGRRRHDRRFVGSRGALEAVADVVGDRARVEHGLLPYQRHLRRR